MTFNIKWKATLDYFSSDSNLVKFRKSSENQVEIDKKMNEWLFQNWNIEDYGRNLLWEAILETTEGRVFFEKLKVFMFYQHLDNPLHYCSHWFDHSILVDAYVQNIIDWTPEILTKTMEKYWINKEIGTLILRLTAIFHDFGYPDIANLAKSMHWPLGWQLFLNEFANTEKWKASFLDLFWNKSFGISPENLEKLKIDMAIAIFFHSADKVENWYLNKIKHTKGEFLIGDNKNNINDFLQILEAWWDIQITYRNSELKENNVFTDNEWNLFKVVSIDWETIIAEYRIDKKVMTKKLNKSEVEEWILNTMIKWEENAKALRRKLIEDLNVDPNRIQIIQDNGSYAYDKEFSSDKYQWRKADKNKWDVWIEFKPIDLFEDPLSWIVRLADNMDMNLDRLTELQSSEVFMNLLYNLWMTEQQNNSSSSLFQRMEEALKSKNKKGESIDWEVLSIKNILQKGIVLNIYDYKTWKNQIGVPIKIDTNTINLIFKDWNIDLNVYKLFIVDQLAKYYNLESDPKVQAIKSTAIENDTSSYSFRHFIGLTAIKDVSLKNGALVVSVDRDIYFNSDLTSQNVSEAGLSINLNNYHIWRLYDASWRVMVNGKVLNILIVDENQNEIGRIERNTATDNFVVNLIDQKTESLEEL